MESLLLQAVALTAGKVDQAEKTGNRFEGFCFKKFCGFPSDIQKRLSFRRFLVLP